MRHDWVQPPRLRIGGEAEEERHATWLELFFDLVFVAAVSQLATRLDHDLNPFGVLGFIILFVPVWWSWIGAAYYATRFDVDDPAHRVLTAFQMLAAAALAVNIRGGLSDTSSGFAISYAAGRGILVIEYIWAKRTVPEALELTRRYAHGFGIAAVVWFASAFVPIPFRFILWGLGLFIDFATPITAGQLHSTLAPHATHLPERFGTFTLIVLGESVTGVVRGIGTQHWSAAPVIAAVLGLSIAFSFWWIYFDTLNGKAISAASREGRIWVYQLWLYSHLPLVIGLASTGVAVGRVIQVSPAESLPLYDRWLVCGSVMLCLLALGLIHLSTSLAAGRPERTEWTLYHLVTASAILLIAVVGGSIRPVILLASVAVVAIIQVVLDAYESAPANDAG